MADDDTKRTDEAEPAKTGAAKSTGTRKRASSGSSASKAASTKTGPARKSSTRSTARKTEPAPVEAAPATDDFVKRYLSPGGDNAKLIYILYLASTMIGLTVLVGLVMAYLNRGATVGTWAESHYTYIIRTFWIGLLYALVSGLLMFLLIGFVLMVVVLIWAILRCVKGLLWAMDEDPVPDPNSWLL